MKTVYALLTKISIYGNKEQIDTTVAALNELALIDNEYKDRLLIQEIIDKKNLKADILYDGNNVWSFKKVIKHFKQTLKSKPSAISEYGSGQWDMSNYLYKFLSLECGSIAHYNKYGWIGEYPTLQDLRQFFISNEFGKRPRFDQPSWASDRIRILEEIERILKIS